MMLQLMPQTASMHDLKNNTSKIVAKFKQGPVLILNRSTPQTVCISPEQWNATVKHIAYLERIIEDDRRSRELDQDPSAGTPFTKAELFKRNLIMEGELEVSNG